MEIMNNVTPFVLLGPHTEIKGRESPFYDVLAVIFFDHVGKPAYCSDCNLQ